MKKWLKICLFLLAGLILSFTVIYFFFTGILMQAGLKVMHWKAGLTEKKLQAGLHRWSYLEAGQKNQETIVFIHGFGANMNSWTQLMEALKNKYHVLAPDMPGFGQTLLLPNHDYKIPSYVHYLHEFLSGLKLNRYHLVGLSMGGLISGYYTTQYTQNVTSLTLMDTAGVLSNKLSPYQIHLLHTGENLLAYRTIKGYDKMMTLVFSNPPSLPYPIKKYFVEEKIKRLSQEEFIFKQMIESGVNLLGENLHKIKTRTLVLWGENDQIIDVTTVELLKKGLKNAQFEIYPGKGHGINLDAQQEVILRLKQFLAEQ